MSFLTALIAQSLQPARSATVASVPSATTFHDAHPAQEAASQEDWNGLPVAPGQTVSGKSPAPPAPVLSATAEGEDALDLDFLASDTQVEQQEAAPAEQPPISQQPETALQSPDVEAAMAAPQKERSVVDAGVQALPDDLQPASAVDTEQVGSSQQHRVSSKAASPPPPAKSPQPRPRSQVQPPQPPVSPQRRDEITPAAQPQPRSETSPAAQPPGYETTAITPDITTESVSPAPTVETQLTHAQAPRPDALPQHAAAVVPPQPSPPADPGVFPREPVQARRDSREVPQLTIGQINVLVEDQAAKAPKRANTPSRPAASNPFGLRGL